MDAKEILYNRNALIAIIIDAQKTDAVNFVINIAEKTGYHFAINQILESALIEIGEMWSKEKISLAQGYVAAKVTEEILRIAVTTEEWNKNAITNPISVVLANIEDDFHSLGRKMVGTFLEASGWKVHDLGNDVSAIEIIDKAQEVNAKIVGVSAMMYTSALNIKKVRDEIDKRHLQQKIKLAVGGAIFKVRPELVNEVGGDGTTKSAVEAPQLFSELLKTLKHENNVAN